MPDTQLQIVSAAEFEHGCPSCKARPTAVVRARMAPITVQMAGDLDLEPDADELQRYNAFATNHDAVLCRSCGFTAYTPSADVGITAGNGYKLRFASYRCDDCGTTFDSLEDLSAHIAESLRG